MELAYISVLGTVAGILFAYLGYRRGQRDELQRQRNEYREEGAVEGTLRTTLSISSVGPMICSWNRKKRTRILIS